MSPVRPHAITWLRLRVWALASTLTLLSANSANSSSASLGENCRISSSRDIRVGRRPQSPHDWIYETQIAVDPLDSRLLVASAITHVGSDINDQSILALFSRNGGESWEEATKPTTKEREGDPVVLFDDRSLVHYITSNGSSNYEYISNDGGKSFGIMHPISSTFVDHLAVDADWYSSRYKGNLYAFGAINEGAPENRRYSLHLLKKSARDNWTDSEVISNDNPDLLGSGLQSTMDIFASRSGKLYLPFYSWNLAEKRYGAPLRIWLTTSDDGGRTFSKPWELLTNKRTRLKNPAQGASFGFAIDRSAGHFDGRIYVAWIDLDRKSNRWGIYVSRSRDGGKVWAEPSLIEYSSIDNSGWQLNATMPALKVNNAGVVFLSWYRFFKTASGGAVGYRRVASASIDGGRSFLRPASLASGATPRYEFYENGRLGDYLNVASGSDGRFHSLWMDGRSGVQEIRYVSSTVLCGGRPASVQIPQFSR